MLQLFVGNLDGFKSSDAVGTSIHSGYLDDMVLNSTLDFLSTFSIGGCNLWG